MTAVAMCCAVALSDGRGGLRLYVVPSGFAVRLAGRTLDEGGYHVTRCGDKVPAGRLREAGGDEEVTCPDCRHIKLSSSLAALSKGAQ